MTPDTLVFFDTETTGTDVSKDRIWSFAGAAYSPNGVVHHMHRYFNPCIPVPAEVLELVGKPDLNQFLSDKPTFKEGAAEVLEFLNQGTLCGFGIISFDTQIVWEELYRAGKVWLLNDRPMLDACQIFHKKEKRDLTAALKFYCGEDHTGAHDAQNDVAASVKVFDAMLHRYPDLKAMTRRELSKYCQPDNRVDLAGKLIYNADGVPCYDIGNEKGVPVMDKPEFAQWMLKKDFPAQTKLVLRQILEKQDTKQRELL